MVRTLTRHKPAQLAEQEELLRRAVARGASDAARGAREALVAALADRPSVDVSMTVHAPRVAVPSRYLRSEDVPEVSSVRGTHARSNDDENDADATLLLDLGRFELRTVPATDLGADAKDAKLFNAFRVKISDVAASLLPGGWDPNASWREVTGVGAGLNDGFARSGPGFAPLLPPFGAEATALQALAPVPGRASMEISFRAGALRAALSPARMRQLEAVAAQMSDVGGGDDDRKGTDAGTVSGDDGRGLDDAASASGSDIFSDVGSSVDVTHAGSVGVQGGEGIGPEGFVGPTAMGPLRYSRGRAHELARPLRLQG